MAFQYLLAGCSYDPAEREFDKAERLFSQGLYKDAIDRYSYIAGKYAATPYGPKSQYRIGYIYHRHLKDSQSAIYVYNSIFFLYPESPDATAARLDLAGIYSEGADHMAAIEEYQKLLKNEPESKHKYQYLIAMEYLMMNDFRQARIELVELSNIISNPNLIPDIRFQIANIYYIEGNFTEAMKRYDEVVLKYPGHGAAVEALFGKAKALDESGRYKEALAIYSELLNDYPNRKAVETRIGWIENRMKAKPLKGRH